MGAFAASGTATQRARTLLLEVAVELPLRVIVRLYQSQRRRGSVRVTAGFPVARAWRCDLLERNEHELAVRDGSLSLELGPFEIASLRLEAAGRR
jgi:alpha-mannosidase